MLFCASFRWPIYRYVALTPLSLQCWVVVPYHSTSRCLPQPHQTQYLNLGPLEYAQTLWTHANVSENPNPQKPFLPYVWFYTRVWQEIWWSVREKGISINSSSDNCKTNTNMCNKRKNVQRIQTQSKLCQIETKTARVWPTIYRWRGHKWCIKQVNHKRRCDPRDLATILWQDRTYTVFVPMFGFRLRFTLGVHLLPTCNLQVWHLAAAERYPAYSPYLMNIYIYIYCFLIPST